VEGGVAALAAAPGVAREEQQPGVATRAA
jgi:hypothetical protein